jgi:hypothetical protein
MTTNDDSRSDAAEEIWFETFAWPVPRAFAAALAAPRFEQGDVLFRDRRGYEPLSDPIPAGLEAIQVLSPARSSARSGSEASGLEDRRRAAWNAEVVIERVAVDEGRSRVQVSTQGRLFTALWRGRVDWLDADHEPPPLPRLARELQGTLETTRAGFSAGGLPSPGKKGCRFLFVRDLSSDASLAKSRLIEDALRSLGGVEVLSLTPAEAGVEDGDAYHPTLQVRGCFLSDAGEEAVREALRAALYGGSVEERSENAPATDEAVGSGRFSLARHGLLESI